jgi:hypothetical protein
VNREPAEIEPWHRGLSSAEFGSALSHPQIFDLRAGRFAILKARRRCLCKGLPHRPSSTVALAADHVDHAEGGDNVGNHVPDQHLV